MTIQTPTDPIRDEAVKVLAEALDPVGVLGGKPEFAANIAMRHPTLARRLALGTALDADPEALSLEMDKHWLECDGPRWFCTCGEWVMGTLGVRRSDLGEHLLPFTRHGVEASLAALAAKLGSGK